MPAYTHLQRAEPVLVAHWLLAYVEMFLRDARPAGDCRERLNFCPLGSGAIAGATLAARPRGDGDGTRTSTARPPTAWTRPATAISLSSSFRRLRCLGLHLSRWAEEMIIFSTTEFGFVNLPETFSTGSSAMPQKQNPDLLELSAENLRVLWRTALFM